MSEQEKETEEQRKRREEYQRKKNEAFAKQYGNIALEETEEAVKQGFNTIYNDKDRYEKQ